MYVLPGDTHAKHSVSCLNAKAIPIRNPLSLILAVSQNCRFLVCKCTVVREKKKNLQERKLEKHQLQHPKISANEIHGEIQVELNDKIEMNRAQL